MKPETRIRQVTNGLGETTYWPEYKCSDGSWISIGMIYNSNHLLPRLTSYLNDLNLVKKEIDAFIKHSEEQYLRNKVTETIIKYP